MKIIIKTLTFVVLASVLARAQQTPVQIAFDGGRVTLSATDVPVADVLAEWARVGGTRVIGGDRLPPRKVTLNLVGVDERTAIEAVVGLANGLLTADRANVAAGQSRFEGFVVVASSGAAPAARAATPAPNVDATMPESRFAYPAPSFAGDPGDPDSLASKINTGTRQPDPTAEPPLMPEMRFQYTEPMAPKTPDDVKPTDGAKKPDTPVKKPGSTSY